VLAFGTRGSRRFDDDLVAVVQTVVDYFALADQRLRTEDELRQLNQNLESTVAVRTADLEHRDRQLRALTTGLVRAEQEERERIAQVLHDDLQQLLYSAQMRLGLVDDELGPLRSERIEEHFSEIGQHLDDGIALARGLSVDLAPQVLHADDFGEVIRWLAHQMTEMHDLTVDVQVPRPIVVADPDLRIMLYQTIRELLFNVVKHAETDGASIVIASRPDELDGPGELEVEVSDDGRGFDVDVLDDPARRGRGLLHIQHRLDLLGGELRVESIPGDGTRARLRFPQRSPSELAGSP
jgi:two-component system CheB/CheR fusion protein